MSNDPLELEAANIVVGISAGTLKATELSKHEFYLLVNFYPNFVEVVLKKNKGLQEQIIKWEQEG